MTITNIIIKTPDWTGVWMTSCPEAMGWEFGDFWKKQLVEIWLWAGPVQLGGGVTVGDVGTVSIVKIVSLSPRVENLKVQKLINVSYLNNGESSVFRIFLHLYILHIHIWCQRHGFESESRRSKKRPRIMGINFERLLFRWEKERWRTQNEH